MTSYAISDNVIEQHYCHHVVQSQRAKGLDESFAQHIKLFFFLDASSERKAILTTHCLPQNTQPENEFQLTVNGQ